jgi:cytochrome c2
MLYFYLCKRTFQSALCLFLLQLFINSSAFAADGEKLFKVNCASCHTVTSKKLTGPGLQDVDLRIPNREWAYKWVQNSTEVIKSGDTYANKIFQEYAGSVMTPFPALSNQDIDAILDYVKTAAPPVPTKVEGGPGPEEIKPGYQGIPTEYVLVALFVLFLVLILVLGNIKKTLQDAVNKKQGLPDTPDRTITESIADWFAKNKRLTALGIIVLMLWGMKSCWYTLKDIGVNEGYMPEQPIAFSHKIHAGANGIACVYCHFGAEKSKTAGIPPANVCMNCHKAIDEGSVTGKTEIAKIYASLDYDPKTQQFGPNKKPIEWVRVHNLPDLAYFNHSQHVTVAGIECQKCHGPVETMDTLRQFSSLTMGWCIDCHRESEVKVADNPYYEDYHKNLKERYAKEGRPDKKITVESMGGTECQKCHY